MRCRWIVMVVVMVGCKKAPVGDKPAAQPPAATQAPAAAQSPADAAPAWRLAGNAALPTCGEKPLQLPAPKAGARKPDRPLPHADAIRSCRNQTSVTAACACLAKTIKEWGGSLGLSPAVECEPLPPTAPEVQIVSVSSKPADESTASGQAFVLVAKQGSTWSPVAVIEAAPDVDLSVTPRASHSAKLDRVESHGNIFWIESHNEAQEKEMGESNREGEAHGTLCVVGSVPWCGRLLLGDWTYALTVASFECTVTKMNTYSAMVEASSVTVRLDHGTDENGVAGRYTY